MNELFINKTKCTKKDFVRFQNSYKREYAVPELMGFLFYVAFFLFCIILSFMSKEYKLGSILICVFILYLAYKFIYQPNRIKKQEKSNQLLKEYINTYIFYNNYFKTKNIDGEAQTFYFKIYKVIETKTNFYIYVSRDYAFIISKSGFKDDKCEEFTKFIKKKTRFKYKVEKV